MQSSKPRRQGAQSPDRRRKLVRSKHRQVGALPVRRGEDGGLLVLLVTSRETRRWVIPKGWPWPDQEDHVTAAGEAREEAGVIGVPFLERLGSYSYIKRQSDRGAPVRVVVYVLEVTEELANWPEQHQRQRAWFSVPDAAQAVQESELSALISQLPSLARFTA
jgi:8-oxo-dGTP pyrophosphatase MutT (NUDIX family)